MGGYLAKSKTNAGARSADDDTAIATAIKGHVPVAPLVDIIVGYMFYVLPCVNLDQTSLPLQFATCPARAVRLFGAQVDRDALVCDEIERFLTLRRALLALAPATLSLLHPCLEGVGVKSGGGAGHEMLVTKHNVSRVAKLVVRPELTGPPYRDADLIDMDDIVRFGDIMDQHCHPNNILLKDCMPDRFTLVRGAATKYKYNFLSREYLVQETPNTDSFPGFIHDHRRLCALYVAWEVLFEGTPGAGCVQPTAASDVYAFGCLLFRVVMGYRPWAGQEDRIRDIQRVNADTHLARHKYAGDFPPPLSPFALVSMECTSRGYYPMFELIDRCLDPDPQARPSMAVVLRFLTDTKYHLKGERPWAERLDALRERWKDYGRSQGWGSCLRGDA